MPVSTLVLRPDDADWDIWLSRTQHDFYFRAAYHEFSESMGEGCAHMVVHGTPDEFVAWPYLICDIDSERVDGNSVYGYTGPVGAGLANAVLRQEAWDAFRAVWKEQKLVTLFTRFHPILQNSRFCEGLVGHPQTPGGEIFQLGRTVSIDLDLDKDERRRSYKKILRQEINSSERAGLVVELDHDWSYYKSFMHLYRSTMEKNEAPNRYLFSDDYFESLRRALGDTGYLAVAHMSGEPAALLLFTVCGSIAQAHLTGVNSEFHSLSPLKLLIDGVADLSRTMGAGSFHLGAGRGGFEDSLFDFKCRFSPVRHEFELGRWIVDRQAYDSLVDSLPTDRIVREEYFPAYRG